MKSIEHSSQLISNILSHTHTLFVEFRVLELFIDEYMETRGGVHCFDPKYISTGSQNGLKMVLVR